ncbi:hypothetical protein [Streptosporangium sp. 'caverna']|nr:hypothetical protein DKM19_27965 [Streptosporangium sp. 'caverna']
MPPYSPKLNPVERTWAHLKTPLANLTCHTNDQLHQLIHTRLKHISADPH